MSQVMTQLHEEHRNIAKILDALEHQLGIFDSVGQPDYDVLEAIADYFMGFPERCHHPKENLIYRKMCERNPAQAEDRTDLEAEHEKISGLAKNFQAAVRNVLQEVEVSRSAFDEVARHFLKEQRHHMQMEEEHFFPQALATLNAEDWAEIDRRVFQENDPVFGGDASREFAVLREHILKWEAEDEAEERTKAPE